MRMVRTALFGQDSRMDTSLLVHATRCSLVWGNNSINWPWKQLWKSKMPYKVHCFMWLVASNACIKHINLQRWGVIIFSRCFFCSTEVESGSHLFLHCPVASQIWSLLLNLFRVTTLVPYTVRSTGQLEPEAN